MKQWNLIAGRVAAVVVSSAAGTALGQAQEAQRELFEARIRPALIEHCYPCHNSVDTAEGGLTLDHRAGMRTATNYGTAVVPGRPDESLLLSVIRHEIPGLEMPDEGARLTEDLIADFERWIRDGAFDPRETPPTATELAEATAWPAMLEKRKQWWSLQPIRDPELPSATAWSEHPVDRFIAAKLTEQGLAPAEPADRRTLIRRLTFVLTGLPPTLEEIHCYLADEAPDATERLIDRLLASPHYGERWARHWMDVVRYADSHGSEGDPTIPHAYQYRDYLIRAFNEDVPYDQLVREHIAGDLLPEPRLDETLGVNESAIGTAHWRMVFHGFAPTDALDEKVRFTDDQINVFGKAFLAQTISCARCHDHKFDAISQADYTALFGILGSCRPTMQDVSSPARQESRRAELAYIKNQLRHALADDWLDQLDELAVRMMSVSEADLAAADDPRQVLSLIAAIEQRVAAGADYAEAWSQERSTSGGERLAWDEERSASRRAWDLSRSDHRSEWYVSGNGSVAEHTLAGAFAVELEGERVVTGIYPESVLTHRWSTRHRGILQSKRFRLEKETEIWLRVAGSGQSIVRPVIQNYPRSGTVYPIDSIRSPDWYWHRFDLAYWTGDDMHLELTTAQDAPVEVRGNDRSWFALREVRVLDKGAPAPSEREREWANPIFDRTIARPPESREALVFHIVRALSDAIEFWEDDVLTDGEALLMNAFLRDGLLPNTVDALPEAWSWVDVYRGVEAQVPVPTRVPGIAEADASDAPIFERGDHRRPGAPVPRRFLEAIDPTPYRSSQSGRLELALVHVCERPEPGPLRPSPWLARRRTHAARARS